MRRLLLSSLVALALLVTACASSTVETGAIRVEAETTTTTTTTEPAPDPARWEVEIATAVVPVVEAQCRLPLELASAVNTPLTPSVATANGCPDPGTPDGKPALSVIPGSVANVGSAQVAGGWNFNNPTYFDNPLVFLVVDNQGDWLEVMVPTRPNQQTGWIRASDVEISTTRWRGEISVSTNNLKVWDGDDLIIDTGTVGGAAESPTPLGRFYVNEIVTGSPNGPLGSFIFSTNAYSEDLEQFDGGLPVFAVHGTTRVETIGTNISNGCVRVLNEVIEQMAALVPAGTPIDVVA